MLANIRPVDERECSRVLAEATATHTPVAVIGSGSKQQIGRPDAHGRQRVDQGPARHHAL